MKHIATLTCLAALLFAFGATAQTNNKHFAKDGLSFDYPDGWSVADESTADAQQLTLTRSDSPAMIKFFVHRGKVNTPEKLAQAKTKIIDPYVAYTEKQFVSMGAKPERADATTQIAGANAEGVHITAVLEGEAGEAGIYWATIGERLVVLTLFGPDKALKKVQPSWEVVRNSLKVEANAKPSPSPKQP
jgi:hypothetical protein